MNLMPDKLFFKIEKNNLWELHLKFDTELKFNDLQWSSSFEWNLDLELIFDIYSDEIYDYDFDLYFEYILDYDYDFDFDLLKPYLELIE